MIEIGYEGYIGYELCHQLPVVDGQTVGIDYADHNARLAAELMREIIDAEIVRRTGDNRHGTISPAHRGDEMKLCGVRWAVVLDPRAAAARNEKAKLLFIGQSKGYQHDSYQRDGHALQPRPKLGQMGHLLPHRLHGNHQKNAEMRRQEP